MSFMHLSLMALGCSGIAIPIMLHFLMRQRPKRLIFPSLQFLVATHARNRRDLRVRHWLLLALRCALIAALALALARPTIRPDMAGRATLLGLAGGLWMLLVAATILASSRRVGTVLVSSLFTLAGLATLLLMATFLGMLGVSTWQTAAQEAPIAAVMLIDLSPRMDYLENEQSRVQRAQLAMRRLLKQIPSGSEVAILTTLDSSAMFSASPQEIESRLDHLATGYISRSLPDSVALAQEILQSKMQERREIYIFSDLTGVAWNESQPPAAPPAEAGNATSSSPSKLTVEPPRIADQNAGSRKLKPDVQADGKSRPPGKPDLQLAIYLIDVGAKAPTNIQVADIRLSSTFVTSATPVELEVELEAEGSHEPKSIRLELWLEVPDATRPIVVDGKPLLPELVLRDSADIALEGSSPTSLQHRFKLRGLPPGTHHGRVRLASHDGLTCDDERFFTVDVGPPWRVLVVEGPSAESSFLVDALAPYALRALGKARYECQTMPSGDLDQVDLSQYAAVALVDPAPLTPPQWRTIQNYVFSGGGLAIFLGRNATPVESFHDPSALELLPGTLTRQWRAGQTPLFLAPREFDNPILHPLSDQRDRIPWDDFPIYRHWLFSDVPSSALPFLRFGNDLPAAWERKVGKGRVVTLATPISDPLNDPQRPPWNRIPTGPDPWPYLVLVDGILGEIVGSGDERRNYLIGEKPNLAMQGTAGASKAQVFTPAGTWQSVAVGDEGALLMSLIDLPGTYRLRGSGGADSALGFSANLGARVTRLRRVEFSSLVPQHLPKETHYIPDPDHIERALSEARVGRDVYPWLMMAAALLLATEQLLANRFYQSAGENSVKAADNRSRGARETIPA